MRVPLLVERYLSEFFGVFGIRFGLTRVRNEERKKDMTVVRLFRVAT